MIKFSKSPTCPLSSDLLAFENGVIAPREKGKITVHLRFCEFCAAEVEFYNHYPQAEDSIEGAEIPPPLFELAEALLSNKHKDNSLLKRLFHKADEFKFTDI